MKTDTLKKSLLDYAIKGKLTARFRRENNGLNAFNEINTYNEAIKEKRKDLEKKLKICEKELKLEKDKDKKALFKSQIQMLKKEIAKCKEITPLFNQSHEVQPLKASSGVWGVKGGIRGATSQFKPPCPPLKEKANNTESTHNEAGESEAPFEIPNSWAWVKLGDICEIVRGGSPRPIEKYLTDSINGFNWIKISDSDIGGKYIKSTKQKIIREGLSQTRFVTSGSLLLTNSMSFGRPYILNVDGCIHDGWLVLSGFETLAKIDYLYFMLSSNYISKCFHQSAAGGVVKNLTTDKVKEQFIPLPPLCEQQEIVKKLDLLVSLANDFAMTKENLKRIEKRIEKSLLKLALEGSLSKLYRRSSPTLSAFNEINTYNEAIKEKRKNLEKELKKLESTLKKVGKRDFSPTAQNDKQRITQNAVSLENDKKACHTDLECSEREVSKNTESQLVIFASVGKSFARASECEKSTKELKQNLKSQIQALKKEIVKCKEITPLFNQSHEVQPLKASSGVWGVKGGIRGATSRADEVKPVIRKFKPPCPPLKENNTESTHNEAGESEAPFTIPNSWAWVKLGDICEINPKNDISDNVEISFIPMALIADSCQNTFTYELKLWKEVKGGFTHLCDNSVAFAKISPCFENGKSFVVKNLKNGYGAGTTELIVLLPYNPLLKEYVFYCVNSAFFVNQALKTFKGTAGQQRLNMDFVENFTIPLPPLCEQEHIVQTLDTLFTLKKGLRVE